MGDVEIANCASIIFGIIRHYEHNLQKPKPWGFLITSSWNPE